MFMDNVEVRKGVAQNEPYNGPTCDRPQPSFCTRVHYHEVILCLFNQFWTHGFPHWKMIMKTFIVNMHWKHLEHELRTLKAYAGNVKLFGGCKKHYWEHLWKLLGTCYWELGLTIEILYNCFSSLVEKWHWQPRSNSKFLHAWHNYKWDISRGKLVHYNHPLRLVHCDSWQNNALKIILVKSTARLKFFHNFCFTAATWGCHPICQAEDHVRQKQANISMMYHQNESRFDHFPPWVDVHCVYCLEKNGCHIWWPLLCIKRITLTRMTQNST